MPTLRLPRAFGSYLTQVSLLLISVLLALAVDRCNQNRKDADRWQEYRTLIAQELERELRSTRMNLTDNANDVAGLEAALAMLPAENDEQRLRVANEIGLLVARGVFRTFPPLTYELMVANNDSHLIEDIELRQRLSAYASFRQDYIQADLARYDALTLELIDRVSPYLDLLCLRRSGGEDPSCIIDTARMNAALRSDITKLYRHGTLRAFHLEKGATILDNLLTDFQ